MRIRCSFVALCSVVCAPAMASAQVQTLTLSDVFARAREQAPKIVHARLTLEEVRARLAGASVRFQTNPEVEGAVGNRSGPEQRFTDFEVGISQMLEPSDRRAARVAGVEASIAQGTADIDQVTRTVLRSAAIAYYRALHATERIRLFDQSESLAADLVSAANRRFEAGDIAILDVNVARASRARIRGERQSAEAERTFFLGELRQILRIEGDIAVSGALATPVDVDLAMFLQAASIRPELAVLDAALREAESEIRLGATFAKPEYGFGVRYAREEGDHIVLGAFKVALPAFSKGQELKAVGSARAARIRAQMEMTKTQLQIEVRSAFEVLSQRVSAIRVVETDLMPELEETVSLTTRGFEAGQLGVTDLLLIRREILEARFQYLDALLEAALARIELDASAGMLR
jgi:cobalt-zinc-cadmium efflux system outer membrane protein